MSAMSSNPSLKKFSSKSQKFIGFVTQLSDDNWENKMKEVCVDQLQAATESAIKKQFDKLYAGTESTLKIEIY